MKRAVLASVLVACLAATAHAGFTTTFTFDTVGSDYGAEAIETSMEAQLTTLGHPMNVEVAGTVLAYPANSTGTGPFYSILGSGSDLYIADQMANPISFSITFGVPIESLSLEWAVTVHASFVNSFKIYADNGVTPIWESTEGTGLRYGSIDLLELASPAYKLTFADSHYEAAIGIDNLEVTFVPLPASVLLGVFAVGLAGRKLRKFI